MALRSRPCVVWRRGRKPCPPRLDSGLHAEGDAQYFQVGVTVLEAKRIAWSSTHWKHCFVVLSLHKTRLRTRVCKNMAEPLFKEAHMLSHKCENNVPGKAYLIAHFVTVIFWKDPYFDFDLYMNEQALLQLTVLVSFMELKCCASPQLLGETKIRLRDIWIQPGHHLQNWYQLTSAKQPDLGPVGLISLDISIGNLHSRHEATYCAVMLKSNKTISKASTESQWANYMISVYQAFGLTNVNNRGDNKPPSTFIRVSLCNLSQFNIILVAGAHFEDSGRLCTLGLFAVDCHLLNATAVDCRLMPSDAVGGSRRLPSTLVSSVCKSLTAAGKTDVQQRTSNPVYNEKISIVDIFPTVCSRITFEVLADTRFNVLASSHLKLSHVSHEGENGFLPTFGPSLLQLYCQSSCKCKKKNKGLQEGGPYHCGALLVALETVVPHNKNAKPIKRCACVEPLGPLGLESVWQLEEFCLFCSLFEVSLLDCRPDERDIGIAITMEELALFDGKSSPEFSELKTSIKELRLHHTGSLAPTLIDEQRNLALLYFANAFPVLQVAITLPDFRYRMYRNNIILGMVEELEKKIVAVEGLWDSESKYSEIRKVLNVFFDSTAAMVIKAIDILELMENGKSEPNAKQETTLDQKQHELQKQELEKIYSKLSDYPQSGCCENVIKPYVANMLVELREIHASLQKLIFKSPDGWPKIVIWLLNSGSRVAYAKLSAADILFSNLPEQCGQKCGKVQTLYMKSLKCGPPLPYEFNECLRIPAKVELMMWLGPHRQSSCFASSVPSGYTFKLDRNRMFLETTARVLECRIFIYKANLSSDLPADTMSFVRVYVLGSVKDTLPKGNPTPMWDQTLRIQNGGYVSVDKVQKYPPEVLIEVWSKPSKPSMDQTKTLLVGRTTIKSVVEMTTANPIAPRLEYHDLVNIYTQGCGGQIMVAAQTVEITENLLHTTFYQPYEAPSNFLATKDTTASTQLHQPPEADVPCQPCETSCSVPARQTQEACSCTPNYNPLDATTNIPSQTPVARGTNTIPKSEAHEATTNAPSFQHENTYEARPHQPRDVSTNVRIRPHPNARICKPREVKINLPPSLPLEMSTNSPLSTAIDASTGVRSNQPPLFPNHDIATKSTYAPTHQTQEEGSSASSCEPCRCQSCRPNEANKESCQPCLASAAEPPCRNKRPCEPCPLTTRAPDSHRKASRDAQTYQFHETAMDTYKYRNAPKDVQSCQLHKTSTNFQYKSNEAKGDVQSQLAMYQSSHNAVDTVERLPSYLKPQISSYKVDIFWWGLREVDNSIKKSCAVLEIDNQRLKSDIIDNESPNCNFPNHRIISQTMQTSFDKGFSATVNFTLYSSSSFGRTIFYGSHIVKNSRKFLVDWISKNEREFSLKSASLIKSSDPLHGVVSSKISPQNTMPIYTTEPPNLRNYNMNSNYNTIFESTDDFNKTRPYPFPKDKKWFHLFHNKDIEEEQFRLLPPHSNEKTDNKLRDQKALNSSMCTATLETNEGRKSENQLNNFIIEDRSMAGTKQDWWTRYLISEKLSKSSPEEMYKDKNAITIFDTELESQAQFSKFKDWCHSIKLYKSQKTGVPKVDRELFCGILKAGVAIYRWPPPEHTVAVSHTGADLTKSYFEDHLANTPSKYLVRIYIVRGVDLMLDTSVGLLDSYVVISCGKRHLGDRDSYVPKSGSPVFGRMYELTCTLPEDYLATISVYNHDQSDTLIGQTNIDIENRIYSKHRAMVGLASEYRQSGPNKWRDCVKPSSILEEICCRNHISAPSFLDSSTVIVNDTAYRNTDAHAFPNVMEKRENICLSLLHQWHRLPICGYPLVPQHVETRKLYNPDSPGMEQGKLQMWVDIFPVPLNGKIPAPVDITPPTASDYELRVTVRALSDLRLKRGSEQGATVYITAWIGNQDDAQVTDAYDSMSGRGALPWVMLFSFKYQSAEKKILLEEKGVFTEITENKEPILEVRVVQCDGAPYTYIGALAIDLHAIPKPAALPTQSALKLAQGSNERPDLFNVASAGGWWPLVDENLCNAGSIELDLSLSPKGKKRQMTRIGRMKMSESSGSFYSSEPSVSQEEYHSSNAISTILNQHSLRILIGLIVIGCIYCFCSVSCYVISN